MLTLMLLRHAKAVAHGSDDDFSRGLTEKGQADALKLGAHMAWNGPVPDFAFVSAAARTQQTYQIFEEGTGRRIPARLDDGLYNATALQLRDLLKIADPAIQTLMIVGHNPGIMDAAILLGRDGDPIELAKLRNRFPPGALAVLTFETDNWIDARATGGRLDILLMPEDIVPTA